MGLVVRGVELPEVVREPQVHGGQVFVQLFAVPVGPVEKFRAQQGFDERVQVASGGHVASAATPTTPPGARWTARKSDCSSCPECLGVVLVAAPAPSACAVFDLINRFKLLVFFLHPPY